MLLEDLKLMLNEFVITEKNKAKLNSLLKNKTVEEFYRDLNKDADIRNFIKQFVGRELTSSVSTTEAEEIFKTLEELLDLKQPQ